ncbi:MAG: PAS domain S-box protein [Kiritimatiellae bacterium]|nr:PAS domain S-box protein [Kiritimatiellia bacterium]
MERTLAPLRQTEAIFKTLASKALRGIVVSRLVNNKPTTLYANRTFCRMTRYSASEIKAVDPKIFFRPCDLKMLQRCYRARLAGNQSFSRYETCLVRKDKSTVPVEVTGTRTIWNGQPANLITFFDLSEMKKSYAANQENELRYRTLAESSPDIIFLIDRTGHVCYVNPRAAVYLRRRAPEIIGRQVKELFPRQAAIGYLKGIRSVFETGKPLFAIPGRLPHSGRWIETRLIPIQDAAGHITHVMGISRDVTRQFQAEEALKENAELFRLLTTNSFDGVNICAFNPRTRQRRLVYSNARYVKISGYSCKALKQARDLNALVTLHAAKSERKRYYRCTLHGIPYSGVASWNRPDGRPNTYEWTAIPYKKDGRYFILGIDRDITKRQAIETALRLSEEKFSRAFMVSPIMIVITTLKEGRIIDVSIAAQRVSGYTRQELIGRRMVDVKIWRHPADRRRMRRALRRTGTIHDMEFQFQNKAGNPVWVSLSANIIEIHNERCVLSILRDITERKHFEAERRQLPIRILEAQEKERHAISAMLHDHLGQLLTLAKMEVHSVRSADDESRRRRKNAVKHIGKALVSIRNIAMTLRPPMLDDLGLEVALETLVEDVAHSCRLRVTLTRQGPLPVLDASQKTCLYRVLQEALNNAVRHSKGSRIRVTLRTHASHIYLQVEDNGQGFHAKDKGHRPGLGMLGMQERLANCGGHLQVQSQPHKGTVLTAVLPLSPSTSGVSS